MKTTEWDRVVTSAPLNKDAAVARDGSGTNFTPMREGVRDAQLDELPPIMAVPDNPQFRNFTGVQMGRLRIIGYVGSNPFGTSKREDGKAAWLCKCVCGSYEIRRTPALKRAEKDLTRAQCNECRYLQQLRTGEAWVSDEKLFANRKVGA